MIDRGHLFAGSLRNGVHGLAAGYPHLDGTELLQVARHGRLVDLDALLREQFNLRMQRGIGQLSKPSELRRVRRDIARVRTVLNEKKQGEAS